MAKKLFEKLERDWKEYKFERGKKEDSRKSFLERIKNAQSDVWLLGTKYPNWISDVVNPIKQALDILDKAPHANSIKVYIFTPMQSTIQELKSAGVYSNTDPTPFDGGNVPRFKNLDLKILKYGEPISFGASAIDLETDSSWIHISQMKPNEEIKDAPYFNFEENGKTKEIVKDLKDILISIKEEAR